MASSGNAPAQSARLYSNPALLVNHRKNSDTWEYLHQATMYTTQEELTEYVSSTQWPVDEAISSVIAGKPQFLGPFLDCMQIKLQYDRHLTLQVQEENTLLREEIAGIRGELSSVATPTPIAPTRTIVDLQEVVYFNSSVLGMDYDSLWVEPEDTVHFNKCNFSKIFQVMVARRKTKFTVPTLIANFNSELRMLCAEFVTQSLVDYRDSRRLKIMKMYHEKPHGFRIRGSTENKQRQISPSESPSTTAESESFVYMDHKLHAQFLNHVLLSIEAEDPELSFNPMSFTQKVEDALFESIKRGRRQSLKRRWDTPIQADGPASRDFHRESCIVVDEEETVIVGADAV